MPQLHDHFSVLHVHHLIFTCATPHQFWCTHSSDTQCWRQRAVVLHPAGQITSHLQADQEGSDPVSPWDHCTQQDQALPKEDWPPDPEAAIHQTRPWNCQWFQYWTEIPSQCFGCSAWGCWGLFGGPVWGYKPCVPPLQRGDNPPQRSTTCASHQGQKGVMLPSLFYVLWWIKTHFVFLWNKSCVFFIDVPIVWNCMKASILKQKIWNSNCWRSLNLTHLVLSQTGLLQCALKMWFNYTLQVQEAIMRIINAMNSLLKWHTSHLSKCCDI